MFCTDCTIILFFIRQQKFSRAAKQLNCNSEHTPERERERTNKKYFFLPFMRILFPTEFIKVHISHIIDIRTLFTNDTQRYSIQTKTNTI